MAKEQDLRGENIDGYMLVNLEMTRMKLGKREDATQ